jgi:hypothetical protein
MKRDRREAEGRAVFEARKIYLFCPKKFNFKLKLSGGAKFRGDAESSQPFKISWCGINLADR